jgi:hypothetical protein
VVEKEKLSGKRRFKIFFFPASACAGKENSAVQNGIVSVFCYYFFKKKRKRKCNLEEPKNRL